jgi:ectoine hydroxylase-related dioxygenase (phytanoyl-CoA dioxygenase family)
MFRAYEIQPKPEHWGIARLRVATAKVLEKPRLVVDCGPRWRSELELPAGPTEADIGIHTHLLPNGACTLAFRLVDGKRTVGRATVRLLIRNEGRLAHDVAAKLTRHGVPLAFVGPCDAAYYPYQDAALSAWFDRPDALAVIDRRLAAGELSAHDAQHLRDFVLRGYVVLEDLLDDAVVDAVNLEIDDAIAKGWQGYVYESSQRLERLHEQYPAMRRLWVDRRHLRIVDLIFGVPAWPCQTLTYVFGSQQDAHQDTIHLTPFPAGYMCGTWIALEDIVPDSGELVVYPGSHREPRIYMKDTGCPKVVGGDWSAFGERVVSGWIAQSKRFEPVVYRPRKGTVLIWHENLLHAGSLRRDMSRSRRSVVIHSFAQGAIAYFDSTGIVGESYDPSRV